MRLKVIIVVSISLLFSFIFSGCAGKPVQNSQNFNNLNDSELVQIVISSPRNVGLVGIVAGQSYDENTRKIALKELMSRHTDWNWQLIDKRQVRVGMTEHEARLSWGKPRKINRASYGDQWIYGNYSRGGGQKYLYFENGRLTGWN